MIGNGGAVGSVVQVQGDVAPRRNQLGGIDAPIICRDIPWHVAVLGHASGSPVETAKGGALVRKRASVFAAVLVLPFRNEILHVGRMGVEAEADVMGHRGILRLNL